MEIRIYFEGNKTLRSGFEDFFSDLKRAARESRSTLELVAARDGPNDFRKAVRSHPQAWNILLRTASSRCRLARSIYAQGSESILDKQATCSGWLS